MQPYLRQRSRVVLLAMFVALMHLAAGWFSHDYFWLALSLVYVGIARTTLKRRPRRTRMKWHNEGRHAGRQGPKIDR